MCSNQQPLYLLFLIFFGVTQPIFGQESKELKFITRLSLYRDEVLARDPDGARNLAHYFDIYNHSLYSINTTGPVVIYSTPGNRRPTKAEMSYLIQEEYERLGLTRYQQRGLSDESATVIRMNIDLYLLISLGLLEQVYPFKIDRNQYVLKHFMQLDIQDGQRILFISTKPKEALFLSSLLSDSATLVSMFVPFSAFDAPEYFTALEIEGNTNHVELITEKPGQENPTNFDRIFVMLEPEVQLEAQLLQLLHQALNSDGKLILTSPYFFEPEHERIERLGKKEMKLITSNGFSVGNLVHKKNEYFIQEFLPVQGALDKL